MAFNSVILRFLRDGIRVNPSQFRRLYTREDAHYGHLHKILGGAVLLHFCYRMFLWLTISDMRLTEESTKWWMLGLIGVHAMLHVTSFQFIIPSRRNARYNVIWPEMRWHTLIFAYRSILCMLLEWSFRYFEVHLFAKRFLTSNGIQAIMQPMGINVVDVSDQLFVAWCLALRWGLVMLTMLAADGVTLYYRSHNKSKDTKETNEENALQDVSRETSKTMRANPYPDYVPPSFSRTLNLFYSTSQVLATMHILTAHSMERVFMLLLPIQTAPFCMTLVKKGVINQAGWHFWYTLALLVNYALVLKPVTQPTPHFGILLGRVEYVWTALMFILPRFTLRSNKYILWTLISLHLAFSIV